MENTEALTIGQLLAVVKIKRLLYYGILAAIAMYSFFSTAFGFTPLVAEQLFAANAAQLSMISSLALFASLISSVACSYIPNHVNNRLISFISFVGIGISTALIPFSPSLTFLYLMQTINGFLTNFMSVYSDGSAFKIHRPAASNGGNRHFSNHLLSGHCLWANHHRLRTDYDRELSYYLCAYVFIIAWGHHFGLER